MSKPVLILSCEHAVDVVPKPYQPLFEPFGDLLATHRGIDFGALDMAQYLKMRFDCELYVAKATRLLIDCNRSLKNPNCFSEVTKPLDATEKQNIIATYYAPFRQAVTQAIQTQIDAKKTVFHLSVHSFTPILGGDIRNADVGLLYDPSRAHEKNLCLNWQRAIKSLAPELRVRLNYPYKGTSDGFTMALRKQFGGTNYIGIELESNQEIADNSQSLDKLKKIIADSLYQTLN